MANIAVARPHPMATIIVQLDPAKLDNPDPDIR
jgi:hypothetical protein